MKIKNTPFASKDSPLKDKSFGFAVRILKLNKHLEKHKTYTVANQLMRSGTNPGAMVREAFNAESNADFIHKLAIAQKEVAETQYWLELLWELDILTDQEFLSIYTDADELMKLIRSSILTKKKNSK